MKVNFADEIKKDEQELDLGSDYLKFEIGDNRVRICSPMVGVESVFKNKETGVDETNGRLLTLIFDRKTNKARVGFLPYTIKKGIAKLQQNPNTHLMKFLCHMTSP